MEEQLAKSSSVDETKKLADLLLKIDGGKPSSKLISLLFDMMVSPATSSQKAAIQYIKNKEALILIVTLFPRCSISLQLEILNKITRLAEQSQRNLETCRSSNLLNTCIELLFRVENDALFDKLLKLTEVMARHSFSVTDMRNYFRLLRDTFEKKNMPHLEKLLRSFQSMCYKRGPAAVFDFDGEKSCGLSIPAFKMPAGGYSFCTWLRAEDFQDQLAPGVEPKIYSFLSAENVGVSCYFSRNNLTVAHHNGSSVTSHSFQEFIFQAKTWYFITLVHVPKLFGRSEIKLFVNGKQVGAASLAYPPANMMAKSCIGSDTASNQYSTQISFKGQLGSICLFSEQLTNERIAKLFDIGDDSEQIRSITSDSVVFIYYPRAFSKDIFFDVANNLHAVKLGSLQAILTETVKDALHCVGGLKTLFLLFHHAIDAPSRPTMSSSQKLLAQPSFTPLHSQLLALLLSLVASLLEGSPDNQQEMLKTNGMAVLSYVLESRWKDIIDVNCFTSLENIVAALSSSPGSEKLRDEAYTHLFFNFKFWTSTSFAIQKQFLLMLLRTTMSLPLPLMKQLFGVQKFLDVLQTYYCFPDENKTPSRDKLVSSTPSLGTSMLTVLNSNRSLLKDAELVELRSIVLNMMRHLVNQSIEDHEMQSVLALLQHPQTKARHLIDIENFLLYILYKPVNKAQEAFNNAKGLNVVLNLMNHDDEIVRLNALKITTRYLELIEEKKRKKLLTQQINPWLLDTLSARPFTITTYSVLCCIMFAIPIESLAIDHSNSLRKLEVDGLQRVFCPEMLEVVFKLIRTASLEVKRVVLQDITILMSHSHEDNINLCSVLLNQFGWPEWFLGLLAQVTQQVKSPIAMNTKDKDDALAIKDMLTNFFSTLLHYSFTHTRDGWRVLPDIETYLLSYKVSLNTVNLMRNLYHNLIVSLTSDIKQLLQNSTKEGQQTLKNVFFENIAHLILFVEEFIFVHPKHEAIKLDDPKDRNKLDLNRHHLHIHMHRSKKHRGGLELTSDSLGSESEHSSHRAVSGKWKDFQLCKDLIELAELLMKDPYIDWLWTCDTTSYFGSKKHHVFHSILRQLLALLRESENHLDRAKIRDKQTDLEQAEMLLLGINSQLIKIEENRSRLLQYITVLNNRETEEMKQVDQFFVKTMDRVKFIISVTVKRNNNSFNNQKSQQQNVEVLLYTLHHLFRVFKKSQKHGDSIHIVIFPALKDIIRTHLTPFLTNCLDEGLEETNPFISHRKAFEFESSLQDFVTFIEDCEWKMPLQHKITKCKDSVDYGLLRSVRTVLKRREQKLLDLQNSIDMNKNQQAEYLKRLQTENYTLAHKLNYKETARRLRQLQNEHKRHLLTMKRWNRIWRELNTPRSVWKFDRENDEFVFWKLDKTEQNNRERRKLKRNYEGSHHTEASFTYLKLKWEKELEQERLEKEKKAAATVSTTDGGEVKIKTRPRRKSVATTPIAANNTQKKRKKRNSAKRIEKEKEREIELLSSPRSKIDGEAEINALLAEADAEDFEIMESQHEDEAQHTGKSDREVIFSTTCELIYPEIAVPGRVEVTRTQILFTFDREAPTKFLQQTLHSPTSISEAENPENFHFWTRKLFGKKRKDREWKLHHLTEIYSRRYLLNWTAIEMFFDNRRNFLLNFANRQQCELFHKHVVGQKPKQLQQSFFGHARDLFKKNAYITELWRTRQISNFDYLMFLNKVAGRTYNDLTQYPVFPWIISNYETEKLDLNDPSNYRDLSKPVGALDEVRLQKFQERYDNFIDDNIPPFYYGSHYSTAGAVLFYLIRMEPFTSQFLCLQGGKFDYPDRIFDSIPGTWENCLKSTTDVKELIPEFFYLPEFLTNNNQFDLGTKQNGNKIGNIGLPPWAKNEFEFIRIQREALESDYVSQHLHEWIDLIFGYKQRGEEAIKAKNTFYFLTYEGAIDLNSLQDPVQKQAVIDQIQNFGQTPAQLLIAPHPPRDPPSPNTIFYSLAQPIPPTVFEGTLAMTLQLPFSTGYSLIAYKDSVIAVNRNGEYLMNKWTWKSPKELKAESSGDLRGLSAPQINLPFEIDLDHDYSTSSAISFTPLTNSQNDWKQKLKFIERIQNSITSGHENKRLPTVTMPSHDAPEHLSSAPFLLLDEDPYMVITYGYWDNSFKVTKIGEFDTSKMTRVLQSIVAHKRPVTVCDAAGSYLVTGSIDATLRVFKIDHRRRDKREGFYVKDEYEHVLYGHYDPITAVKLNSDLDIAVSSSSRGICLIHTLTKGRLIRSLPLPADRDSTIDLIQISREGLIVLYSTACRTLWLFSLNGQLLAQRSQDEEIDVTEHGRYVISSMLLTKNGKFLITGGDKHVTVWSMNDLTIVHRYDPVSENVVAINFAHDERALLVALQNGQLTIIYKPNIGSQLIPGNV